MPKKGKQRDDEDSKFEGHLAAVPELWRVPGTAAVHMAPPLWPGHATYLPAPAGKHCCVFTCLKACLHPCLPGAPCPVPPGPHPCTPLGMQIKFKLEPPDPNEPCKLVPLDNGFVVEFNAAPAGGRAATCAYHSSAPVPDELRYDSPDLVIDHLAQ
eukprot:gene2421-3202_t